MTLTEFLLQRIAEDEQAARGAAQVRVREADGSYQGLTPLSGVEDVYVRYRQGSATGHHIEGTVLWQRFSPARVLAECEAKRRIVEEHPEHNEWGHKCSETPCTTLQLLALPYADRSDYLPEWRPER